jgi:hypothetical protein
VRWFAVLMGASYCQLGGRNGISLRSEREKAGLCADPALFLRSPVGRFLR